MKNYYPLPFILVLLLSVSCGDDDINGNNRNITPIGKCHLLFDANGEALGSHGDCINQSLWEEQELLDKEKEWLNFTDDLEFSDQHQAFAEVLVRVYPIPAQVNDVITIDIFTEGDADALSNLKFAVIDDSNTLRLTHAQTLSVGSNAVQFSLDSFLTGQSYRIYYQLADAENSIYYEGYGDFFVCDGLPVIDFDDCL